MIYEKTWAWTDNKGQPEDALTRDEMLDNIMLYWLTGAGASSARLYWESYGSFRSTKLELPVGVSVYPREIMRAAAPVGREADVEHHPLERTSPEGGHFAAWEQPASFVGELRDCFPQGAVGWRLRRCRQARRHCYPVAC